MDAEYLVIDNRSYREAVEAMYELFPQFEWVSSFALVIETIDPVDGPAFVVSSEQEEVLRVFYFVGQEEADDFKVLLTPVHVIT